MKRAPEEKLGQRTPYRIYFTPQAAECQVQSNKKRKVGWLLFGIQTKFDFETALTTARLRDKIPQDADVVELGSDASAAGGG